MAVDVEAMVEVVAVVLAVVAVVTAVEDLVGGETGVLDDHGVLGLHQPQHQWAACILDLSRFSVKHVGPVALNLAVGINDCRELWPLRYRLWKLIATAAIS